MSTPMTSGTPRYAELFRCREVALSSKVSHSGHLFEEFSMIIIRHLQSPMHQSVSYFEILLHTIALYHFL